MEAAVEDEVLKDEFFCCHKGYVGTPCTVTLSRKSITIHHAGHLKFTDEKYAVADVIGCHILRNKASRNSRSLANSVVGLPSLNSSENTSTPQLQAVPPPSSHQSNARQEDIISVYLSIYVYPLKQKAIPVTWSKKRNRHTILLRCRKYDDFQSNFDTALQWKVGILYLTRSIPFATKNDFHPSALDDFKKLLIFLNPKSGPGLAKKHFHQVIALVMSEADLGYDLIVTEGLGHAYNHVQTVDLSAYRGIVIVSGDGLLYEVYNGLCHRKDWEEALKIPIGIIPAGSGNGLARSIADALDEPYIANPILVSTLSVVSAKHMPLNLVLVQSSTKKYLSFLSVGWGLIADIDIESEKLRSIGEARFTVWAVKRLLNLRVYKGRLSYLPAVIHDNETHGKAKYCSKTNQELEDVAAFEQDVIMEPVEVFETLEDVMKKHNAAKTSYGELAGGTEFGPKSRFPPLSEPVPSDWTVCEGDFLMVYSASQKFLGTDNMFAPKSKPSDGLIWLMIVKAGPTKSQLLQVLTGLSDGSHVKCPWVQLIPVKAFRLEPQNQEGNLTVDGERIPMGSVQAEVMAHTGTIMTR